MSATLNVFVYYLNSNVTHNSKEKEIEKRQERKKEGGYKGKGEDDIQEILVPSATSF